MVHGKCERKLKDFMNIQIEMTSELTTVYSKRDESDNYKWSGNGYAFTLALTKLALEYIFSLFCLFILIPCGASF